MKVVDVQSFNGEFIVRTGCLDLNDQFSLRAADGSFVNFFPVHYPEGFDRKQFAVEVRSDGWYMHSASSILNGKVEDPYKMQLCIEMIRGPMNKEKAIRLIAQICHGNLSQMKVTLGVLQNAGIIDSGC